jgi:hypothetical protein
MLWPLRNPGGLKGSSQGENVMLRTEKRRKAVAKISRFLR